MYEKIKSWIKSINPIYIFLIIIFDIIIFYFCSMLGENVHSNRNAINNIRTELNGIEKTKSDIRDTARELEESNTVAQKASNQIDELTRECQSIIEQIRGQHE